MHTASAQCAEHAAAVREFEAARQDLSAAQILIGGVAPIPWLANIGGCD